MIYKFLIYISHTYALPIGNPLQTEILKRGHEVKWFSDLEYTKVHFPENGELFPNIKDAVNYNPHVVLTISDSVADFLPGIKVQIFHGFLAHKHSFKKGHFRIRGFFDLYCTQGPSTTQPFKELQKKHETFDVIETGWSKMDPMFPLIPVENKIPTVLITSTFSPKYSLSHQDEIIEEIERLSLQGNYKFIVVLHPKMDLERVEKFKNVQNENLKYLDTTDLVPLFQKADIMLADTTSALTEFILQGKPVVTINNNKPGDYLINISEANKIEEAINLGLSKPTKLMDSINNYVLSTHPYFDGKSSERVIDACIDFLHRDKSYLKKKPLNLVRKYKVRKLLKYFTLHSISRPLHIKKPE